MEKVKTQKERKTESAREIARALGCLKKVRNVKMNTVNGGY